MSIIFLQDWQRYPGAIPNLETTNRSFVTLAGKYREMGVKNHAFLLALHDRRLVGIDPHDPNLTYEQIAMICVEAKYNPWFFLRECLRVPPTSGDVGITFGAHRGNIALWWLFHCHITMILIQIRQTGKSVGADSLATYLMNIRCNNTLINLLTKDDKLRQENINRIKKMEDYLPFYMKMRTKHDIANTEMLAIATNGNRFRAHVPQKSPKDALKVGRGMTSPIFFIDEAPFQPNIGISMGAALTGGLAAREEADKKGEPWGTVITTTAGKKDDEDGKEIYNMLQESAIWSERFMDATNLAELQEFIRNHSPTRKLRVNITLSHTQLGKSDEWLKTAIEGAENISPDDADRDFFNIWTAGSLSSPLPIPVLTKIKESTEPSKYDKIVSAGDTTYISRWYVEEHEINSVMTGGPKILSIDTSDAQGGDDISLILSDVSSGETIAAGNYNETNLISFAEYIVWWLEQFPTITCIIERKSSGVAIIDYLLRILPTKGIDPFKRLYNRVVNDAEEFPERFQQIDMSINRRDPRVYIDFKKYFGFATSATGIASRSDLYSETLQSAGRRIGGFVRDRTTVDQITSLITVNGRVDHPKGGHDDMVIAWLLSHWILTKAKNLSYYGIHHNTIYEKLKIAEAIQTGIDPYTQFEQERLRVEMEETFNKLKETTDDFLVRNLEHRLKFLNSKLIRRENEIFSIEELINSTRESKRTKRVLLGSQPQTPSYVNNAPRVQHHYSSSPDLYRRRF